MHRRMVPHIFGWFTMSSAWFIIIAHLEWAKADLSLITDRTIPGWVDAAVKKNATFLANPACTSLALTTTTRTHLLPFCAQIYGTVVIFVSFGFVSYAFSNTLAPL